MNTQITIKTDETLKQNFAKFVAEFGLTMSTAINLLMRDCVDNRRINLSLHSKSEEGKEPSPALRAKIEKAREDFKNGKGVTCNTIEDSKALLESL